ncbi:MAG: S26 family signal peptidase [Methanomicrobiales archaeon]|nr:S26 family signal peptidase [Methanomicrobiales archaeon]
MPPDDPASYVRTGCERTFTGEVRLELLRAVLAKNKPFRFTAYGHSMSPFIRNRDILTIEPLPAGSPRAGDVVAFTYPALGNLVVHRVITAEPRTCLIKGDNRRETDLPVDREHILGRVTRVERNGRIVRAGLGCERSLIACMSRHNILQRMTRVAGIVIRIPRVVAGKAGGLTGSRTGDSRS